MQESPAKWGIEMANWNWKVVRQFVSERFGISLSRSSCLNYLHRLGFVLKRPKKRLVKADEAKREAFADATARDDFGITPLHGAAGAGASATVTLLLENGADASAPDHMLRIPLHWAAAPSFGPPSAETIAMLLDGGADINNGLDQCGQTTPCRPSPRRLPQPRRRSWR